MSEPQGYNRKEFLYRIGTFFLLVGIGLLAFFLLSEASRTPMLGYFCWSTIMIVMGLFFRAQYRKSYIPSGRFSVLQRFRPKSKEEKKK